MSTLVTWSQTMAVLPSEQWVIQQIGGVVILFHRDTEDEIIRVDPADPDLMAKAQFAIHRSELSEEDKCFAYFWCGYFYAHARHREE